MEFKPQKSSPDSANASIYSHLANHQRAEECFGQNFIGTLQEWADRLVDKFKLEIPEVVLGVDKLSAKVLGHYQPGHNQFGLKGEITLNDRYLDDRPLWDVLGTLLHELLHAWQDAHGKSSRRDHHNAEFIKKAQECGLLIGKGGIQGYAADSIFKDLLRKHGIVVPTEEMVATPRSPGKSKLKKWTCGCGTNIRCAVADLQAQCLKCNQVFKMDAAVSK